jgi:hypothetical protein
MKQQEESFYKTINTADVKSQYGNSFLELSRLIELHDPMELFIYDIAGEYDPILVDRSSSYAISKLESR